ncbi:hypothetical protein IVB16_31480 [Bradyrhizobium sp. 183]|uniref:FAD-linked oxidase C-terminal domain-containing protein n=1 Tax=Bradyrhizobium sp. 184 TaxID=2782653 RepID=UPI00206A7839|nr:hypothetical protein IVB17_31480 [Bradyrhizobium sp. 184]UPJ87059.1 hypothetical protein IVB16_31480 [Bradyrhizobium sp. 183]
MVTCISACITRTVRQKGDDLERLVYQITGDFDGSSAAEHGIGILKRPYLRMSRTQKKIETMRMLKRARSQQRPKPGTHLHDVKGWLKARGSVFSR